MSTSQTHTPESEHISEHMLHTQHPAQELTSGGQHSGRHGADSRSYGEGRVARAIEEQTARLPSDAFLWAAGGSIVLSLALQAADEKQKALFVGNWAPTFLLLGIYNKLVKLHGSE
jgi:hypothetical protein